MYDAIKNFPKQFSFNPEIKSEEKLLKYKWYIVAGMGGSHLAADILKVWNPNLLLVIHKNYGLINLSEEILKDSLVIASSYSGNTEEVIDAYEKAKENNIPLAAISVGGNLLKQAIADSIPYVKIPDTGIQPRQGLGFFAKAILSLMKEEKALADISKLSESLKPRDLENKGKELAENLQGYVPVIYSSSANEAIAYNWKIKFNETGKIPAFFNVFPELNHNEMTGFDIKEKTKNLSEKFYFIFLYDKTDHQRIQKRMEISKKLYQERKLPVVKIELAASQERGEPRPDKLSGREGQNSFYKIFSSLILADWTAYYTAKLYGVEPEAVPMVEEFKKLIS